MVKVAIAGGSGNVAQEVIDVLVASKKHEIMLLSRKPVPIEEAAPSVTWVKADYEDPKQLADILNGVNTVLSFITTLSDPGNVAQRNLIDAAVQAGVKRFAPSEWASSSFEYMPWYAGKAEIRQYLEELNKDKKVLEYSLFQPGIFVNYYTTPYKSSKHIHPFENQIDFNKRRAITLAGGDDDRITLTTAQDFANVVAKAIEYEGEWPVIGGMKGDELSIGQLIALGEKIRGGPFRTETLEADDLKAGVVKASWSPKVDHPSIPPEEVASLSDSFLSGMLLAISAGALKVTDEWNQLLPDYKFTPADEFLSEVWRDKPIDVIN